MENNAQTMLRDAAEIIATAPEEIQKQKAEGLFFSLIEIMGQTKKETITHSAIIAELLYPDGSHGQGNRFLKLFLEGIGSLRGFPLDTANAKVEKEWPVDEEAAESDHKGRIDILISDEQHAIIIENKIDAGDQDRQLLKYRNYARNTYGQGNFIILYLTKDGQRASNYSTGGELEEGRDYYTISYRSEIKGWLESCMKASESVPRVYFAINQYLLTVKTITRQGMATTMEQLLANMMGTRDNLSTFYELEKVKEDALKVYFRNVVEADFAPYCNERGLPLNLNETDGIGRWWGWVISHPDWRDVEIFMQFAQKSFDDFVWGFRLKETGKGIDTLKMLAKGMGTSVKNENCCYQSFANNSLPPGADGLERIPSLIEEMKGNLEILLGIAEQAELSL